MRNHRPSRAGFTIVEISIAAAVMLTAIALALSGMLYLFAHVSRGNVQDELDIDVQTAMERIKNDLRLSSLEKVFFYPATGLVHTAVSFPMAASLTGDGMVPLDDDSRVAWDSTYVYHVWNGNGMPELRLTVFKPRLGNMTAAQRQLQLDRVVVDGNGARALNGSNASTLTLLRNPLTWSVTPLGGTLDAYAPEWSRSDNASLGLLRLTPGAHLFAFTITGRNEHSSGFNLGIDTLRVTPSYSVLEGEAQLPVVSESGATAAATNQLGGSWSGNSALFFPATAAGDRFTLRLYNDRWEETNFLHEDGVYTNTVSDYDETLSPPDFIVRLKGMMTNWTAAAQSSDDVGLGDQSDVINSCGVRVLLRGEDMINGDRIECDGRKCRVNFRAAAIEKDRLQIDYAYIMKCKSATEPTPDAEGKTIKQLTFNDGRKSVTVAGGTDAWSDWVDLPIVATNSYLVSFIANKKSHSANGKASPWVWPETGLAPTNGSCWIWIGEDKPDDGEAKKDKWSDKIGDKVYQTNVIFAVQFLETSYPEEGTFESQVFDTTLAAPAYETIGWHADVPSGTSLKFRLRTGNEPDLSDALAWSQAHEYSSPGAIASGAGRYVQFLATFKSDKDGFLTPVLHDAAVQWTGPEEIVSMNGDFMEGPDHGIVQLTVDGVRPMTGLRIDLEVTQTNRPSPTTMLLLHSSLSAEVEPRNTRR